MLNNYFKIKTEIFEGPLDLLLNLIEKKKLHINDVALAKVADDYIAYLQNQTAFPIILPTILPDDITPGSPAPGCVPAPTKYKFGTSSEILCGRSQAD